MFYKAISRVYFGVLGVRGGFIVERGRLSSFWRFKLIFRVSMVWGLSIFYSGSIYMDLVWGFRKNGFFGG